MSAAIDRSLDSAILHGNTNTSSGYGLAQVQSAASALMAPIREQANTLTLRVVDQLIEQLSVDTRTLVIHRLDRRTIRKMAKRQGWTLEPARGKGKTAYWLRAKNPSYRILVYASDFAERGQCLIIDATLTGMPRPVSVRDVLTTVTALAMAEVDERLA